MFAADGEVGNILSSPDVGGDRVYHGMDVWGTQIAMLRGTPG